MICHFCKNDRPLVLSGQYEICYNCMRRLRAIAPKLLEALERILDDYEGMSGACGSVVKQARAAIAKVEGDNPERGNCLTCGELVPEGCCTCDSRRRLG